MRIADPSNTQTIFWTRLGKYLVVHRSCGGRDLPFYVEQTRADCVHACTVDDLAAVLNFIPAAHYSTLASVVLRQPKRKEGILEPVWGRLVYWADVGTPPDHVAHGPTIIIEARDPARPFWRRKPATPVEARELERLIEHGFLIHETRSRLRVAGSLEAVRRCQLYHTLPHEIGHLVDYETKVPEVGDSDEAVDRWLAQQDRYWQHPPREREEFAHRYADETRDRLRKAGHIPFARIESWESDGLRTQDFDPASK
ncbi:MAG: hypothetical protein U0Q16_14865 [Bryobacteraceae bacterium]